MEEYLKLLGYHLGRFIYIMDAYDDLEKDQQKGCYNPLLAISRQEDFEQKTEQLLLHEMEEAAAAYQMLPCLEYKDILGNILYAGVWNRFDDIQTEKKKKQMNLQEEQ